MITGKSLICATFGVLLAVSTTALAGQTNQHLSISGTAINSEMISSFNANQQKVSPGIIGEVTLPGSPANDTLFGANRGPDVNDPLLILGGNNGNISLVPEPPTWAMIFLGAGSLVAAMRFRQRRV